MNSGPVLTTTQERGNFLPLRRNTGSANLYLTFLCANLQAGLRMDRRAMDDAAVF